MIRPVADKLRTLASEGHVASIRETAGEYSTELAIEARCYAKAARMVEEAADGFDLEATVLESIGRGPEAKKLRQCSARLRRPKADQ